MGFEWDWRVCEAGKKRVDKMVTESLLQRSVLFGRHTACGVRWATRREHSITDMEKLGYTLEKSPKSNFDVFILIEKIIIKRLYNKFIQLSNQIIITSRAKISNIDLLWCKVCFCSPHHTHTIRILPDHHRDPDLVHFWPLSLFNNN